MVALDMTVRILLTTAALAAALGLSACSPASTDSASDIVPEQIVGTWTIDAPFDSPEQPFLAIAEDGTWTASDGCNRVQGTWDLGEDGELVTESGPSTLMACEGAQLPLAMTEANAVEIAGENLVILSSSESTVTTLVRAADPEVGALGLPVGQWVESDATGAPMLSIAADGTFAGNDGCNILSGEWLLGDDERLEFTATASTLKLCEGIDTWLSGFRTGHVQGTTMTISDADGVVLGHLVRP